MIGNFYQSIHCNRADDRFFPALAGERSAGWSNARTHGWVKLLSGKSAMLDGCS
jgi:hypothetical protein